jgi:hypothetical protein
MFFRVKVILGTHSSEFIHPITTMDEVLRLSIPNA